MIPIPSREEKAEIARIGKTLFIGCLETDSFNRISLYYRDVVALLRSIQRLSSEIFIMEKGKRLHYQKGILYSPGSGHDNWGH